MTDEHTAWVTDLDHDGRGVARIDGKAVFVAGALPGEQVRLRRVRRRQRHDEAQLLEVLVAAPGRVTPPCTAFGRCGGCALQHLDPTVQLTHKSQALVQELERIGHVTPASVLAPLTGPTQAYRRRARLGVKNLSRQGRALIGFRERDSALLADVQRCEVLSDPVGGLCEALGQLIASLSIADRIPQIEVAVATPIVVLVLRVLAPPSSADCERLNEFAAEHRVEFWLQSKGPSSAVPLQSTASVLSYRLDEFDVTLEFGPLDFVQVNAELNARMVSHAIELLQVEAGHSVLDLYCGLGNFTLPLARTAAEVMGLEGEPALIARARSNAALNGIRNAQFAVANLLSDTWARDPWAKQRYDRVLLDPPRAGAADVLGLLARCQAERIVYVSCHPATLARDAGVLVNMHGFRLESAGVMDMFPHTAHVESIAVFAR
jgi:23S rRNA (uracil1939-C5)-methyltransferase